VDSARRQWCSLIFDGRGAARKLPIRVAPLAQGGLSLRLKNGCARDDAYRDVEGQNPNCTTTENCKKLTCGRRQPNISEPRRVLVYEIL